MPQRPEQHEIDTLAERRFQALLPAAWVVNRLHPDYAKDFLVEIVNQGDVTGCVFVVQLKGKRKLKPRVGDGAITVPFDRDHLRYYTQQLPLPVFVVAVDVTTGDAFFQFSQGTIDADDALSKAPARNGRTIFPVNRSNTLQDTQHLVKEVEVAWAYMRDRYPGSVAAAARARKQALERVEPRFDYSIKLVDGREHVELAAKENVSVTIRISGPTASTGRKIAELFDEGKPFVAEAAESIDVEGSPLFKLGGGKLTSASLVPNTTALISLNAPRPRV
jgi:hypothetical protein